MRETRYLWINNLSVNPSEDVKHDIKTVLESHGKIQSVRYVDSGDSGSGIVVAFMDVKSATKALEFSNKLTNGLRLNLEYCESTGLRNSVISANDTKTQGNITSTDIKIDDKRRRSSPDKSFPNRSRSSSVSSSDSDQSLSNSFRQRNRLNDRKNTQPGRWRPDKYRSSEEHSIGQRGLKVTQLPLRSTDTSIREGLFHEYKKHGKITSVVVEGQGSNRTAIITFKKSDDMEKAFDDSKDKIFFATDINVERHNGFDLEDPDLCPPEIALDEFHPKATKTLFVGNLPSDLVSDKELLKAFEKFGTIIDLDIKQQTNQPGTSYAFIQYSDIRSVVRALNSSTITRVCGKPVKLGFGKSQPTNCIWLANLSERIKDHHLSKHFSHFGPVTKILLDDEYLSALVFFASVESAQKALIETKNRTLVGQKVHIDFASIEFQRYFLNRSDVQWMVSPGNNENYRDYSNCNYYHGPFPYDRNPYSDERNRRHFEEIRLSEDSYRRLERQSSYRDYDNQNIKSRSRCYNDDIRCNTSGSGKKHNSKDRCSSDATAAYLFTANNRIRSESPYSVKGSRSRERDLPPLDNNSKSPSHRSSKDRSSRSRSNRIQQHDDREDRNGRRKSGSNSRSHSHRSNSVSNKGGGGGRDSLTRRGVDCGSSATSGNPDSSNSEDSPYFSSSGYSDSHSGGSAGGGIAATTRPPVSLSSSSLVGDVTSTTTVQQQQQQQPTTDRLNYLEQERIQLIMELKRLDSGSDLHPNTSPSLLTRLNNFNEDSDDGDSINIHNESSRSNRTTDTSKDGPLSINGLLDHSLEMLDFAKELEQSKHVSSTLNCAVSKSTTIGCDIIVNSFTNSIIGSVCDNDSDNLLHRARLSTSSPNKLSASSIDSSSSPSTATTTTLRMHSNENIITSSAAATASPLTRPASSQIPNPYLTESRSSQSNSSLTNIPVDTSSPTTILSRSRINTTHPSEHHHHPHSISHHKAGSIDENISSRESPSLRDPRLNPQNYHLKPLSSISDTPKPSTDIQPVGTQTLKSSPFTPNLSTSSEKLTSPEQTGSILSEKQKYPPDSTSPSVPPPRVGDCEMSDNDDDLISNDVSVEERIRLLDNKLKQDLPRARPTIDYSKFMRRKKGDSLNNSQVSTPLSAPSSGTFSLLSSIESFPLSDTSEFMKSMLSSKPNAESYSTVQSFETQRSLESCSSVPLVSSSVIQPLTISTGDISTPSSLSSPGSVSLPARSQFNSSSVSGPMAVAVSAQGSVTQRVNCKIDPEYPVKSILKKDSHSPVNNNNTYHCYPLDSNVTSVCQRIQRPLSSLNPNTPRSNIVNGTNPTHRYNGSLNSPILSTPPLRSSDSGSVHSPLLPNATPSHSPGLYAIPASKSNVQRPSGQPLPSPKPNNDSGNKFTSTTNALSTNTINSFKRKADDSSKKSKASKFENRSSLDESLFSPVVPTKKKKLKSDCNTDDNSKLISKKSSEMLDCSKAEDVSKHSFEIRTESHKDRKQSNILNDEKPDKEKKKKEKSQHSLFSTYSKEATIKKLFGNCDDLDRKKEKKKDRTKEAKQDKNEDKQNKKERKPQDKESKPPKEKSRLHSINEIAVDSNKFRKSNDDEKKIEHNSDSDDGWKIALAVQDPYESMYDKIKRRTSKEAERKQQPIVNDYLKQEKKSRNKYRKSKVYGSDTNLSDSVQSSTTNEASSRSASKKTKVSKSKNKQSKRLDLSDDDLSDAPIITKKSRLDDETDDSEMYSTSKSSKKKIKRIEESSSKRKPDYLKKTKKSRLKEEKLKKKSSDVTQTKKKGLISVDSVFSDSDTSRASSPVCALSSIHDHSSNESKTTPSTEPMDNSETESHSNNPRKTCVEDEWKMIVTNSPLHDLMHSKTENVEKENEHLTIPEDLPCLEKQPEEEIIANSPRSIDDEPPEHLESIYDSPPPPPESESTKELFDNSIHTDDTEQSLAVASILKTEPSSLNFLNSPTLSTTSLENSSPARSPLKEVKASLFEKMEPSNKEPEPPTLPPEAPVLEVKPADTSLSASDFSIPSSNLPVPVSSQKSTVDAQIAVSLPQVTKPSSWESNNKQPLIPPKPALSAAVSVSNSVSVASASSTSAVSCISASSKSYLSCDTSTPSTIHTSSKSSRNIDSGHDAPDYTLYVQSVIERVKQEKDEESHHSRDKTIKRQKKYTSSNVNSQNWSNSQTISERRQSSGSTVPSKKGSESTWNSVPSLPPIPGVNACTPVSLAKPESLTIPISANNKNTFIPTASVLGSGTTTSMLSNVTTQQVTPLMGLPVQFSVNPTAVPLLTQQAPIVGSHLTALPHENIQFENALLQTNTSPHCTTNSQADELKVRKRAANQTNRRSGSFSKTEKTDTLDETIMDVLRKDRESREDPKRVVVDQQPGNIAANSGEIKSETEVVSDDKDQQLPVDPYEPDFDDSPLQINLNRDLHRNRASQSTSVSSAEPTTTTTPSVTTPSPSVTVVLPGQMTPSLPSQFINSFASVVSTVPSSECSSSVLVSNTVSESLTTVSAVTTTTATTKTTPDSIDQVINEVAQGHFDVEKYMNYFKNNPLSSSEEDRNSFTTQDSSSSAGVTDYSDHSNISKQLQQSSVLNNAVPFTMASLLNFNRPDLLSNPMVLSQIQMIPYQQLSLPNNNITSLSNQVQIPGVNTQSFTTALPALDERSFPIDRLHNSLNININNARQTTAAPTAVSTTSVTFSTASQGIVSQCLDTNYPKVTAQANNTGNQAMPSPVLISRPSSNPTGRPNTGGYISTTPGHTSPLASTPRSQTHNGNPTGQSATPAAFNPGAFEGSQAIEYLNLLYQQQRLSLAAAVANSTGGASPAIMLNYPSTFRAATPDGRPASRSSHSASSTAAQFLTNPLQGQQQPATGSNPANILSDTAVVFENSTDKLQNLDPRFRKVWKGRLALKNEEVHVEMNFVHGNNDLIKECMNMAGHNLDQPLKIVQRMRLEPSQLEGVQRKMQQDSDFCMCLALASSSGVIDLPRMSAILRETFIKYLQEKVAAGIINVSHQEYQQAYVVHIFPPCEFSNSQLENVAPNLYKWISEHSVPHLLVVITTV